MKYVVLVLLCAVCSVQAVTPLKTNFDGCARQATMFFAYTKDHKKAVEFCIVPHKPRPLYRYTFGPIDNPDVSVLVGANEGGKVEFVSQDGTMRTGFAVRIGDYIYWTIRGAEGGDARMLVNQRVGGETFDLATFALEDKGWGFIDTSIVPDSWPLFYDPMWDNNDELPD